MNEREKLLPCALRECKQLCCLLCAACTDTLASLGNREEECSKMQSSQVVPPALAQSFRKFKIPFIAYNQFLLLISSPLLASGQLKGGKRNEKERGQIRKHKSKCFIAKSFFFLNSAFSFSVLLFIYCR